MGRADDILSGRDTDGVYGVVVPLLLLLSLELIVVVVVVDVVVVVFVLRLFLDSEGFLVICYGNEKPRSLRSLHEVMNTSFIILRERMMCKEFECF